MRILLASRNFFPADTVGGAQVSMLLLGQALQAQGHDVAVLSVDDHAHAGLHAASGLQEYRLKLRNLYARGKAPAWKKVLWHGVDRFGRLMNADYRGVLEDFRPDVINTNVMASLGLGLWTVAADMQVPIVHTIHDYYLICLKSSMRSGQVNCASACATCRLTALGPALAPSRQVSEVIYVSAHMKAAHLHAGLFSSRTGATVIHGAYRPAHPLQARSGPVDPGRLTIGFFGRISPEKGLDRLILSLATLPLNSWTLRVGGGGDPTYVAGIQALARKLPVEFLGVTGPDAFYASVDAVVVSSLWNDPAPRVAYETGIHGVVPIVADRGGLPELVAYGERGLVFEPERGETLLAALVQLSSNPDMLARFQKNWAAVTPRFDPAHVAQETLAVYERAIAASR
ncbi:MAG: hypothetical protein JWM36_872 [Hyphomicrobiales bacterium]|nr:hypothetical protein [Hyphomicrobiales bacterium]